MTYIYSRGVLPYRLCQLNLFFFFQLTSPVNLLNIILLYHLSMFVTFPFSQSSDIRHACRPTTTTVLPLSSSICLSMSSVSLSLSFKSDFVLILVKEGGWGKASSGRCAGGVAESRPGMVAGGDKAGHDSWLDFFF